MVCEYCDKSFHSRRQHTMHYDKCFKNHQLYLDFISKNNNSSLSIDDNTIILQQDDIIDEQTIEEADIIEAYTTEFPHSLSLLNKKKNILNLVIILILVMIANIECKLIYLHS
jgi:hypothetical protein